MVVEAHGLGALDLRGVVWVVGVYRERKYKRATLVHTCKKAMKKAGGK